MSDSIHHKLFAIPEVTYGVTPAVTPAFSTVRHTSCSLALSKDSFRSAEINATRNLQDFRHGNRQVGGDIGIELSLGTYDTFLEALLMGTWTADVLKVGQTRRSFTMLRNFIDQVTVGQKGFHKFTGVEVNKLALKLVAGKIIDGAFSAIGRDVSYADAAPVGATFSAPTTALALDTFSGSAVIDGETYGLTELNLTIENGLTPNFVLFDPLTELPSHQVCNISGELGVRFRNAALLETFLAGSAIAIGFSVGEPANGYDFVLPKVMLNGGQPDVGGEGPINLKIPFQAIYDSDLGSTLSITRVIA